MKKQQKYLSALLALCLMFGMLLFASAPSAASPAKDEEYEFEGLIGSMEVVNCKSWTSLRKKPDTKSDRLAKVPLGAVVTDCWYENEKYTYCVYDGIEGYILTNNLSFIYGPSGKEFSIRDYLGNMKIVNCTSFASLRKKTDTKSGMVAKVPLESIVTNVFYVNDKFCWCMYGKDGGYILSSNLEWVSGGMNGVIPKEDWLGDCEIINYKSYASLRKKPDSSSEMLAKVPLGAKVTDCYFVDENFACCTYGDIVGYILVKNLGQ